MRRRTRPKVLPIGTISHGTLRPEDLIPAFIDALDPLELRREDRKTLNAIRNEVNSKFELREDEKADAVEELQTMLEAYAPAYCYFDTTEGDGADFGVWPDWSLIDEDVHIGWLLKVSELPSVVRPTPDMCLLVNDHGNAALYKRAGNRWLEVWSVV